MLECFELHYKFERFKGYLAVRDYRCQPYEMNFGEWYGAFAKGFIHVHHLYPLSQKMSCPPLIR